MLVPVNHYLFICALSFVIDHSFILCIIYSVVFILNDSLLIRCSKEKEQF